MRSGSFSVALAVLSLALAGCPPKDATPLAPPPAVPDHSTGGSIASATPEGLAAPSSWRLTEIMGKPVPPPLEGQSPPSLTFNGATGRVNGFAGCNTFSGRVQFKPGNGIRFEEMVATLKACLEPTVESEFLRALDMADNYNLDGQKLVLNKARMAPLARFEAVP